MSGFTSASTRNTVCGLEELAETIVQKRVQIGVANRDHVSAPTSVAAIRTALGNKLLAAKAYCSIAAITCFDSYSCIIYKQMIPLTWL